MKAWLKWVIGLGFMLQAVLGGTVILWWVYPNAEITQQIIQYLATDSGHKLILSAGSYLILIAVLGLGWILSRPTSARSLTLHRDHASKVQIEQKAVENNVRLTLGKYDLFNIEVKVRLLVDKKQADVLLKAMLSQTTDPQVLKEELTQTVRQELKQMLSIDLRRLKLNLKPYHYDRKVTIV